jgi:iron complex outermembrane receptor protein
MNEIPDRGVAPLAMVIGLGLAIAASAVHAQTPVPPAPAAPAGEELQEVVVTGSRVVTNGANAPTPTTAVSAQQLQAAAPS